MQLSKCSLNEVLLNSATTLKVRHKTQARAVLADDLIAAQESVVLIKTTHLRLKLGSNSWIFKAVRSSTEFGVHGIAAFGTPG